MLSASSVVGARPFRRDSRTHHGRGSRRCALSVTQQQVLDALGQGEVAARRRPDRGQCAVGDHGRRRQGVLLDQCRRRARPAPGKASAPRRSRRARHSRRHRGDDRADRRTQGRASAPPPPPHRHARGVQPVSSHRPPQSPALADVEAVGNSRHCRRHRGGLRQRRRRQIDHRAQSGAGPARSRPARRPARRRHLRAVGAAADRHPREAAAQRRSEDDPDRAFRPCRSCRSASWSRKTPR